VPWAQLVLEDLAVSTVSTASMVNLVLMDVQEPQDEGVLMAREVWLALQVLEAELVKLGLQANLAEMAPILG